MGMEVKNMPLKYIVLEKEIQTKLQNKNENSQFTITATEDFKLIPLEGDQLIYILR